jgi:hypothetical protein
MAARLTDLDRDILHKLVNGEAVTLSSQLRLRLEMAGVLRDSARGIVVTEAGRRLAQPKPADGAAGSAAPGPKVARDGRGRRLPFQRRSIF